jgi:hypothetical protein
MLTVPSSTVKKLVVVLRTTTHIGTARILERPEVLSRIFDHAPKPVVMRRSDPRRASSKAAFDSLRLSVTAPHYRVIAPHSEKRALNE